MTEQSKVFYPERKNEGKAKYMSINLAYNLLNHNPDSVLKQSYQRTVYCAETRVQVTTKEGVSLTTRYCKNRWCTFCNRIRTAVLINAYEPAISAMLDGQFMTLTKVTVVAEELNASIEFMGKAWRRIINSKEARRRNLSGVRKAECTIRPNGHYHYHYHVIIDGLRNAEWLRSQWLKEMGGFAKAGKQQHIGKIDEGTVKELFKYFTKLTAKNGELIDYKRMDVIFLALRGKRVYQPFGSIKPVKEDIDEVQIEHLKELAELAEEQEEAQNKEDFEELEPDIINWSYKCKDSDWIDEKGNRFCGFDPDKAQRRDGTLDDNFKEKHKIKGVSIVPHREPLDARQWLTKWPDLQNID